MSVSVSVRVTVSVSVRVIVRASVRVSVNVIVPMASRSCAWSMRASLGTWIRVRVGVKVS